MVDVAAGFAAYALVARGRTLWSWLRERAEAVANSWAEKDFGPIRCLSHGVYGALAVMVGAVVAASLAGRAYLWWIVAAALAVELGAVLWAQLVEGSPQLLRPYGYFGGVAGVLAVAVTAGIAGVDGWLLMAAAAVGGTFAQAIGRLRCFVQGCCHGRQAPDEVGIRYMHPRSRVVRLSQLGGLPLHPTPMYSMIWTLLVGCLLLRLWALGSPLQLIAGSYFILIGLGRFVEEHFRGEPQPAAPPAPCSAPTPRPRRRRSIRASCRSRPAWESSPTRRSDWTSRGRGGDSRGSSSAGACFPSIEIG